MVLGEVGGGVGEVDAGIPQAVCELPDLELSRFGEEEEGGEAGDGVAEMDGELGRCVGEVGGGEALGVGDGGLEVVEEVGEWLCRQQQPEVRRELRYQYFRACKDLKMWI